VHKRVYLAYVYIEIHKHSSLAYPQVKQDGSVLGPAILYCDSRAEEEACAIEEQWGKDRLCRETGNWKGSLSILPKLLWCEKYRKEDLTLCDSILLGAHSFLALQLCGSHVGDRVTASTTGISCMSRAREPSHTYAYAQKRERDVHVLSLSLSLICSRVFFSYLSLARLLTRARAHALARSCSLSLSLSLSVSLSLAHARSLSLSLSLSLIISLFLSLSPSRTHARAHTHTHSHTQRPASYQLLPHRVDIKESSFNRTLGSSHRI